MAKLSIRDLNVTGKRVLMRVDYNVPMEEKDGVMVINDTTRIKETLPTLELLISRGPGSSWQPISAARTASGNRR